jgi:hypothetical protein
VILWLFHGPSPCHTPSFYLNESVH